MNISKYYILIAEGITDCSLLEAMLEKFMGFIPYNNKKELPLLFQEMIGNYQTASGELKRQDSPTFYHNDEIAVAVKQTNGHTNIPSIVDMLTNTVEKCDAYDNFGGFLIFCDADLLGREKIKNKFQDLFEKLDIIYENELLTIYNHEICMKLYVFPNNGNGAVEKLLLECANISYNSVYEEAQKYRNIIMTDEFKDIRKECWASQEDIQEFYADKVQFGAVSTVLKPDRPVRFAIKDRLIRKEHLEEYSKLPQFSVLHNFLKENLIA